MKLFNLIEIQINLLTKKNLIMNKLNSEGYLQAISQCKQITGWPLNECIQYVKKIRGY